MAARILIFALGLWMLGPSVFGQDSPALARKPTESFVIGIEDQLLISVYENPELTMSVKVRPDGRISLPLIQDVEVADRTPEEVRDLLATALAEFLKPPIFVTVIVEQINSFRVYFLGEVTTQGPMQFLRPVRFLQAVAHAGGPTEFAKKIVTVLREEYGVERRIEIDYKKLLEGDPSQENIYLRPGDTLIFR
jgi:polysaccharide export outer membrane protein